MDTVGTVLPLIIPSVWKVDELYRTPNPRNEAVGVDNKRNIINFTPVSNLDTVAGFDALTTPQAVRSWNFLVLAAV